MQGAIHDVTILHNIKLMREPARTKSREFEKRLAKLYLKNLLDFIDKTLKVEFEEINSKSVERKYI